jgi:hypothetical protein
MINLSKISGFRSGIINALIDCVRMQRPVAGPGVIITEGPGGTAISLARRTSSGSSDPSPWKPTISTTTLTISDPIYLRSPKYTIPSNLTFSLSANDGAGDYYAAVKISVLDGTIDSTLLLDKTLATVVYTSLAAANADADYMRLLVCILTCAIGSGGVETWSLKLRCITSVPELGLYV